MSVFALCFQFIETMTSSLQQIMASTGNGLDYDKEQELKTFDDTKAGVKGLVDSGIQSVPKFFVASSEETCNEKSDLRHTHFNVPIIDLRDIDKVGARCEIVKEIGIASSTWGFFQVVNHDIPQDIADEVIESIQRFNEQPNHVKEKFYSRDKMKKVRFNSNFDLYKARFANWRDTLSCLMAPNPPPPEEYPEACRYAFCVIIVMLNDALQQYMSVPLQRDTVEVFEICYKTRSGFVQVTFGGTWPQL